MKRATVLTAVTVSVVDLPVLAHEHVGNHAGTEAEPEAHEA